MLKKPTLFGMKVFAVVFGVVFLVALSVVSAQTFATLTVIPYGNQTFDLATGITTLTEGGEIVQAKTDLVLKAEYVRYLEGAFIEASGSTITGKFGQIQADKLYVDIQADRITSSGDVTLSYNDLFIRTNQLQIFLEPDIAVLEGDVVSEKPEFTAASLVLDLNSEDALLLSPYEYKNTPFTLKQQDAGGFLQLSRKESSEAATAGNYEAQTQVDAPLLDTLRPYFP